MLFNSISYFIFFPLVLCAYWLSPKTFRRALLLVASYVFYMSWMPVYGFLLFCMTFANFGIGLLIDKRNQSSSFFLAIGVVLNLALLCYYKYTNFLIQTFNSFLGRFGEFQPVANTDIILPLGISFFVFEFIHYLVDVHRGGKPIKNIIDFALFAAFFPSQIAGPIKRYQDFVLQLGQALIPKVNEGIRLLLQGLFKKVALADNLALVANAGFSNPSALGGADALIACLAFTFQIYFDFSGYTDMGRGSAYLLGFSLPDNFNLPYIASNLSDFWKRWHISLSSWLRDYLYIPLGGGRCSRTRKHANLLLTMLLGGLWHGASWHFVVWGALHGAGLVISHEYDAFVSKTAALGRAHKRLPLRICSSILTLCFVILCWIFFRAESCSSAFSMVHSLVSGRESQIVYEVLVQTPVLVALVLYSIYGTFYCIYSKMPPLFAGLSLQAPSRAIIYLSVFFAAIAFAPSKASPFLYFQF
ncbi:MAG: hypothetical protein K2X77_16085 [Candidatus Obscuribacterales bacterium]|jgi:D-alanyl-lipoteichoic acid acyltransferase DltB (MBOAT superfamily)|nr:hypothetical protein [Candidatus Obscuribacterales bacterium]